MVSFLNTSGWWAETAALSFIANIKTGRSKSMVSLFHGYKPNFPIFQLFFSFSLVLLRGLTFPNSGNNDVDDIKSVLWKYIEEFYGGRSLFLKSFFVNHPKFYCIFCFNLLAVVVFVCLFVGFSSNQAKISSHSFQHTGNE